MPAASASCTYHATDAMARCAFSTMRCAAAATPLMRAIAYAITPPFLFIIDAILFDDETPRLPPLIPFSMFSYSSRTHDMAHYHASHAAAAFDDAVIDARCHYHARHITNRYDAAIDTMPFDNEKLYIDTPLID